MPRRSSLSLRSLGAALPRVESIRSRLGSSNKSQYPIYPIRLFDLPPELTELIFDYIFFSRGLVRAIRLRRVNSQFKHFIDETLFRIGLHDICETGRSCFFPEVMSPHQRASLSYLNSHLMRHVLKHHVLEEELDHILEPLGRIRHVARTLCGGEDDLTCLSSLLCLCSKVRLQFPPFKYDRRPFHNPFKPMIERDIFVANAYLGRKKKCIEFMSSIEDPKDIPCCARSEPFEIFGNALDAVTLQGNLEMIKLLISQCPKSCGSPYWASLPRILRINSAEAHQGDIDDRQAIYDFVFEKIQSSSAHEIPKSEREKTLRSALYSALEPKSFERVFPLVDSGPETLQRILGMNVRQGRIEMVRHLLKRGVSPNPNGALREPIMDAVWSGHDGILSMLLDYKANPNHTKEDRATNVLMAAVWQDRVPTVKILLDRGANPNEGHPAPLVLAVYKENIDMYQLLRKRGAKISKGLVGLLAMEVTYLHGLSSMRDILVKDGVCRDRPGRPGHRLYPPYASGCNYFYRQRVFDDPEIEENKRRLQNA
ncbi:ankyrin repeat-containing domain protein [Xylaria sp. FL0043]|nr:ankyrin repeat-containing domain protein [Xylaria sp. FL0043]